MITPDAEVQRRLKAGDRQLTVEQIAEELRLLGYKMDRSMDARCQAKIMTGPAAGESYPCCTTYLKEADTGLSAFNVNARRDANFRALQQLRREVFAVVRGYVFEL